MSENVLRSQTAQTKSTRRCARLNTNTVRVHFYVSTPTLVCVVLALAVVAWDSPRPPRPSPTTKNQIVKRTLGPGNSSALPAPCPHKARHLRHEALLEELLVALEQRRRHLLQVCGGYTLEKHEVRSFSEAPGFCPISKQNGGSGQQHVRFAMAKQAQFLISDSSFAKTGDGGIRVIWQLAPTRAA